MKKVLQFIIKSKGTSAPPRAGTTGTHVPHLSFICVFFSLSTNPLSWKHVRTFAWNSNPGHKHGRYVCCRYTKGAFVHGMSWICFPIQKTTLLANALISFGAFRLPYRLPASFCHLFPFPAWPLYQKLPPPGCLVYLMAWIQPRVRKVLGSILSTSLDSFCSCLDQCFAFPRYFTQFFAPIFRLRQLACSWVLQLHVQLVGLSFF